MDGASAKKSISLETLVIQNITNQKELKAKLNDIIKTGKDYDYDVSSCIKSLINSSDQEIMFLSVQAIAELSKCEDKRESYAHKDTIEPLLGIVNKELTSERLELMKQGCRALGNLCCDCDTGRQVILQSKGVPVLVSLVQRTLSAGSNSFEELKLFSSKILLNFTIGGKEMCDAVLEAGLVEIINKIMVLELEKDVMNASLITTVIMILSVINDNAPDHQFSDDVNCSVLNVLKETTNMEISELCFEHLHMQAEHDSVKTLLAKQGGVELVCSRLEVLVGRRALGDLITEDAEVEAIMKQACDLIIIVLTGDEAMHLLYNNAQGDVYLTMVKWLDSTNYDLLTTAVLAIGNFARKDDYCIHMYQMGIFDKLLDIFSKYHKYSVQLELSPETVECPVDAARVQHAAVSSLRNLAVPPHNKRASAADGKAAPLLLKALPNVKQQHVAYKLLATLRMLVSGQESVCAAVVEDARALAAAAAWGGGGGGGGGSSAAEAPRLLAWCLRHLPPPAARPLVQVEGCISCIINMLVASHSVMQNEAILALILLAIECLKPSSTSTPSDFDYEKAFVTQLIKSEIGKHVSVLISTNCAKMPIEVAENLLNFLDITSRNNELVLDYKAAQVDEALHKIIETRNDLSEHMKSVVAKLITTISADKE